MRTQITLSQAIDGYLLDARARQLSTCTISDYCNAFRHFTEYIGDPPIAHITADDIRAFLSALGNKLITPRGCTSRPARPLSKKSILNIHTALSSLWTWAIAEGFADNHIVRAVRPAKPEQRAIKPFSRTDVQALLLACERSKLYTRPGKAECSNTRPTADRDRAILLLLLDTGIRASELAADPRRDVPGLLIGNLDQRNLHIKVLGKGDKERIIPISNATLKAVWRYLVTRNDPPADQPLFLSFQSVKPLTRNGLLQLIKKLGERADVPNAHPHRFRHTFAINFLRNGGKTLELQRLLGHTTLEMVKRYVDLAQVDLEEAHRRASPVANWNL